LEEIKIIIRKTVGIVLRMGRVREEVRGKLG
jgi:hypothetical protein